MRGFTPLILGILGTFAFSWIGLALIPNAQIGHLEPQSDEEGTDIYPMPRSGLAERGRQVYVANGCVYCHTQQVRAEYAGSDLERKWGTRRSAPRDYIFDRPALIGRMRTGPDLARVGKRYSDEWHRAHLVNPRDVVPESNMPGFPWLAENVLDGADTAAKLRSLRAVGVPGCPWSHQHDGAHGQRGQGVEGADEGGQAR